MPMRGATFPKRVANGDVPAGARARLDRLPRSYPLTAGILGPFTDDGVKSTSQRIPEVTVSRGFPRQVSCAKRPRFCSKNSEARDDCKQAKSRSSVTADATLEKIAACE